MAWQPHGVSRGHQHPTPPTFAYGAGPTQQQQQWVAASPAGMQPQAGWVNASPWGLQPPSMPPPLPTEPRQWMSNTGTWTTMPHAGPYSPYPQNLAYAQQPPAFLPTTEAKGAQNMGWGPPRHAAAVNPSSGVLGTSAQHSGPGGLGQAAYGGYPVSTPVPGASVNGDAFASIMDAPSHTRQSRAAAAEEDEFGEFSDFSSAPVAPSGTATSTGPTAAVARGVTRDRPLDIGLFEEATAAELPPATPPQQVQGTAGAAAAAAAASADAPEAKGIVYQKGDQVRYVQRDGTLTSATVIHVDKSIQPYSYGISIHATGAERETEGHRLRPARQPVGVSQDHQLAPQTPMGVSAVDFGDFMAPPASQPATTPSQPPSQPLQQAEHIYSSPEFGGFCDASNAGEQHAAHTAHPPASTINACMELDVGVSQGWPAPATAAAAAPNQALSTVVTGATPSLRDSPASDDFGDFESVNPVPPTSTYPLPAGLAPHCVSSSPWGAAATRPPLSSSSATPSVATFPIPIDVGMGEGIAEAEDEDEDDGFGTFSSAEAAAATAPVEVAAAALRGIRAGPLSLDVFGEEDAELQNAPISWEALRRAAVDADLAEPKAPVTSESAQEAVDNGHLMGGLDLLPPSSAVGDATEHEQEEEEPGWSWLDAAPTSHVSASTAGQEAAPKRTALLHEATSSSAAGSTADLWLQPGMGWAAPAAQGAGGELGDEDWAGAEFSAPAPYTDTQAAVSATASVLTGVKQSEGEGELNQSQGATASAARHANHDDKNEEEEEEEEEWGWTQADPNPSTADDAADAVAEGLGRRGCPAASVPTPSDTGGQKVVGGGCDNGKEEEEEWSWSVAVDAQVDGTRQEEEDTSKSFPAPPMLSEELFSGHAVEDVDAVGGETSVGVYMGGGGDGESEAAGAKAAPVADGAGCDIRSGWGDGRADTAETQGCRVSDVALPELLPQGRPPLPRRVAAIGSGSLFGSSLGDAWCALLEASLQSLEDGKRWWEAVQGSGLAEQLKQVAEVQNFFAALAQVAFVWRLLEVCARVVGGAGVLPEPHLSAAADLADRCRAAWELPLTGSSSSLESFAINTLPGDKHPASVACLRWRPTSDLEKVVAAAHGGVGCARGAVCALCGVPLSALAEDGLIVGMTGVSTAEGGVLCLGPLAAMWRGCVMAKA